IIYDRLMGLKKSGDYLARLTGDEFIFFLTQVHSVENTKYFAERILSTVKKPVEIEGHQFHVASSIGIAFAESNIGAYELLRNADLAKVNAKEQDRNNIQFYIKEMSEVATNKLLLAERIRRGIQQDEFVTFYQLQVELSTMKVIGAEALIRWNHPERGIVSAVEFVEVAETQGLIGEIGEITLEKACSDAVKWRMEGHQISLAVNISAEQFSTKSLVEKVTNVLSSKNLPAHALEIEITESAAMKNPEDATELINELKAIGVSIAIDDFGTGYSSLAYLKRFDIDFIKIDKSFIKDLPNNIEDATIARAICTLGHSLNLRVIAEGVESMDQVNLLRSWKVDEIQGYIISKPIPYDEFILLLKEDFLPDGTWKKFTPT
uniref:putative bifunctional diguanylate cyclase/phosphodiesterase n=1 Tax=Candidatus Ichthyocystis hellenicum TaxID=1561003 RepID=UPI001112BD26